MEFTGERYIPIPDQPGYEYSFSYAQVRHEHWHRYVLSMAFATGKQVLDIASGEGYGSSLLARVADSVTGVDIDPEAIEHAKSKYKSLTNLEFLTGSCAAIPIPAASIDVVTSFETLEHHDRHEEMMREVKRVLKPGGVLVISSPNKLIYTEKLKNISPYHIKELYYDEFCELLGKHFKHYSIFGQKMAAASFIYPLENTQATGFDTYTNHEDVLLQQVTSLPEPVYFIAVCSDQAEQTQQVLNSLYLDTAYDVLRLAEREKQHAEHVANHHLENQRRAEHQHQETIQNLIQQIRERDEAIGKITGSRAWRLMQALWRTRTLFSAPKER